MTVNVTEEFMRRWQGSYMSFRHPATGDIVPLLVDDVEGSPGEIHTINGSHWYSGTARGPVNRRTTVRKELGQVNLETPDLGVVNLRGSTIATYITLRGERQWRNGLTRGRLAWRTALVESIPLFSSLFPNFFRGNQLPNDLFDVFNPTYIPLNAVIGNLERGEAFSQAFSPRCWAAINSKDENILIGYKMWPVGVWNGESVDFFSHALPYQAVVQEDIHDHFYR